MNKEKVVLDKYYFLCEICNAEIQYFHELQSHLTLHHAELPYRCEVCFERFGSEPHLTTHSLFHKEKERECNLCDKSFKNGALFVKHSKLFHGMNNVKPFECSVCFCKLKSLRILKQHFSQHSNFKKIIKKDVVQCYTCNKHFISKNKIGINMYLREGDPLKCNTRSAFESGKKYEKASIMNFYCISCLKFFKTQNQKIGCSSDNRDLDLTSYKCKECKHFFQNASYLKNHKCFNVKPKLFICKICNCQLSSLRQVKEHKIRIHFKERAHTCYVCSRGFYTLGDLKKHLRTHTGEKPFICDVCQKAFSVKYNLNDHKRLHTNEKPFVCNICHKTFSISKSLRAHKRIHTGEKPYVCDICQKAFSDSSNLKVHKRKHTNEKPYACDICHLSFSDKSNLRTHHKKHDK